MRSPMRRSNKESVHLEGEISGAVKQHKSTTALDYCFPSAQLGVPTRSGGPHPGRGRRTQIPTLDNLYTEDSSFLPLTPPPSRRHVTAETPPIVVASPVTARGLFPLQHRLFLTYC